MSLDVQIWRLRLVEAFSTYMQKVEFLYSSVENKWKCLHLQENNTPKDRDPQVQYNKHMEQPGTDTAFLPKDEWSRFLSPRPTRGHLKQSDSLGLLPGTWVQQVLALQLLQEGYSTVFVLRPLQDCYTFVSPLFTNQKVREKAQPYRSLQPCHKVHARKKHGTLFSHRLFLEYHRTIEWPR